MTILFKEVSNRFPEIKDDLFEGDEELPYVVIGYVADWVRSLALHDITRDLIKRLQGFSNWCHSQPEGQTAADDLNTILVVGLYESLATTESGRRALSYLMTKKELESSSDYMKQWLGIEDYTKLLAEYKKHNK